MFLHAKQLSSANPSILLKSQTPLHSVRFATYYVLRITTKKQIRSAWVRDYPSCRIQRAQGAVLCFAPSKFLQPFSEVVTTKNNYINYVCLLDHVGLLILFYPNS